MCVSVCMCLLRAEEGTRTPGGTGATGGFEPPNKGAGHQTWAPWKSRNHVSSPILLLPFFSESKLSSLSPGPGTGRTTDPTLGPSKDENTIPVPFHT